MPMVTGSVDRCGAGVDVDAALQLGVVGAGFEDRCDASGRRRRVPRAAVMVTGHGDRCDIGDGLSLVDLLPAVMVSGLGDWRDAKESRPIGAATLL